MQIYLLAANLFSLAALLVALGRYPAKTRDGRLLPLFLLVISRSLSLIISMILPESDPPVSSYGIGALEVFSTFCLMWALIGPIQRLPGQWLQLGRIGAGLGVLLSLLPLIPNWPIPPELHSLSLALFGMPYILVSLGQVRWTYLTTPLLLTFANFLFLVDLPSVSWLLNLLGYAFFVNIIHWQQMESYDQAYQDRQEVADAILQEAVNRSEERQRWFEVGEIISNVLNLSHSMEHIAQSMAHVTHADQVAIFMLEGARREQARLAVLYSPERPVHLDQSGVFLDLVDCPPLHKAVSQKQQIYLPQPYPSRQNINELDKLYRLWEEERLGPTVIQPLFVQEEPVGVLVLGNPVTHRPLRQGDVRMCQVLAPQIASLVEHRRRYVELEGQTEAMMATALERDQDLIEAEPEPGEKPNPVPEPVAEAVAVGEGAMAKETGPSVRSQPFSDSETTVGPDPMSRFEFHRAILKAINNGVVVSDIKGRIKLVNPAAERILGKSSAELIDQPIGTIYGTIDTGEPIEDLVVAFSRRNQPLPTFIETDDRAIQGQLVPWRNEEREWLGMIVVFRDVSREVKAERARNDFITALSRELRAPLTAVKGYSELITNGTLSDYTEEQIRVQQIIHSSAERMVEVLDNAIQITADKRQQTIPRFEETDVLEVINQALREIRPLVQLRELTLSREIKSELPPVAVDPRHFFRILDNLLSNACRFTPPGGHVTLRAWIQTEREGNSERRFLLLAVTDNGVGVPASETRRIFDPFYQVKTPGLEEQSGMGMGLTVVKELVELHNGRVWVESVVGEGSVFQVALPITQQY